MKSVLAFLTLAAPLLWAADKLQPFNVKLGLWETTVNFNTSGAPPIPDDMLAKMTPEQRAHFEEMMKSRMGGSSHTHKYCLTKEKLEKDLNFAEDKGKCTHEILSSSSSVAEVKFHCVDEKMTSEGIAKFQALNSESVKGTAHVIANGSGKTMTVDSSMTSHWLGSSCGDLK